MDSVRESIASRLISGYIGQITDRASGISNIQLLISPFIANMCTYYVVAKKNRARVYFPVGSFIYG